MRRPIVTETTRETDRAMIIDPMNACTAPAGHAFVVPVVRELLPRPSAAAGSAW
jgi:hypothetical protein